ncbi:GrpB family protein [Geomicrobium sediminis]|uniref:GrpB-like predicted nucleotidyltransferase (UPF0157 family) n=1 Tax=Geomicrobium sediminis TaxID=1347788 RepID=A0ABS2PCN0_9BACL|nr:GrpB family protein [Geomicrobium sediminis]MBM7633180.1 GrpB-like predicted nucleotidyltransferase (UPF0157 family) [Geomicrobium sediminis]
MRDQVRSDEELQAVTVGERKPHNNTIELHEYNPTWPAQYQLEEEKIYRALQSAVVQLEHVGSTSIPRMSAKPIIDILLVVHDSANESRYVQALESIGYKLVIREPDWYEHRLLKRNDEGVNLHVFSEGCEETGRMLTFRDHLRTNEEDFIKYKEKKQELSTRTWRHVQHYADAKSEVVEEIIHKANR